MTQTSQTNSIDVGLSTLQPILSHQFRVIYGIASKYTSDLLTSHTIRIVNDMVNRNLSIVLHIPLHNDSFERDLKSFIKHHHKTIQIHFQPPLFNKIHSFDISKITKCEYTPDYANSGLLEVHINAEYTTFDVFMSEDIKKDA